MIVATDGAEFAAPVFDPDDNSFLVSQNSISSLFSTSSTYSVGDYVTYQDCLYRCTTAIATAGAWDSSKWSITTVMDSIGLVSNSTGRYNGTVVGDGVTREFVLTHNLGIKVVFFQIFDSDDNLVLTSVSFTSNSALSVGFGNAPISGKTYRVIIRS